MTIAEKLAEERRARLAAEQVSELNQAELQGARRKLGEPTPNNAKAGSSTEFVSLRSEDAQLRSDLARATKKAEIAERRLWTSIQTISDGFAFFDADSRLIAANPSYLAPFDGLEVVQPGIRYAEILQVMIDEGLVNCEDETPEDWRMRMQERWDSPTPHPVMLRLWNNQYLRLTDQRSPFGDVISMAYDITANVHYQAELTTARQKAEAASRTKSTFLANMSHEIRTPMNGVVGMADLLSATPLTEEQQLYVSTIRNSGEALLDIINDVLDYSKMEAQKLSLNPAPFDLEHCVHEVMMLLQPAAQDKGLRLAIDCDLFLPVDLIGDKGRIRQILTNLVGNAVKFTESGHVLIRMTGVVDEAADSVAVHLTVEDTGIGIAPDQLDHIFGEFNQVEGEANRSFEGTGLGLAIAQSLVRLMGGDIWVDSTFGEGTSFGIRFSLPLSGPQIAPPAIAKQMKRALVVDPVPLSREILTQRLIQLGLDVDTCLSAQDAETQLQSGIQYDLMIAEEELPDTAGHLFVDAIAKTHRDLPVILVSGQTTTTPSFQSPNLVGVMLGPLRRSHLFKVLNELPTLTGAQQDDPATPVSNRPGGEDVASTRQHPMRILAAEDNRTNQLVLSKMLEAYPIDLHFAENGKQAVDLFEELSPDLILMDISMPQMDGKEATRRIRKLEAATGAHTPIVALTAHAAVSDQTEILDAGLDACVTKPLRKAKLLSRIALYQPEGFTIFDGGAPSKIT